LDRLIPPNGNINYFIAGGGHFMVVDDAEAVSKIINKLICSFEL
jgi:hypothetical protein